MNGWVEQGANKLRASVLDCGGWRGTGLTPLPHGGWMLQMVRTSSAESGVCPSPLTHRSPKPRGTPWPVRQSHAAPFRGFESPHVVSSKVEARAL